jgi:hypothetical protein
VKILKKQTLIKYIIKIRDWREKWIKK